MINWAKATWDLKNAMSEEVPMEWICPLERGVDVLFQDKMRSYSDLITFCKMIGGTITSITQDTEVEITDKYAREMNNPKDSTGKTVLTIEFNLSLNFLSYKSILLVRMG